MIDTAKVPEAEMLLEQFIPDHVFLYIAKGEIDCYDGNKSYTFKEGEYGIARKNRLARYKIRNGKDPFEPLLFCFDEAFLRSFQEKHKPTVAGFKPADTFIKVKASGWIPGFIRSLQPYYDRSGKIDAAFEEVKYEELLIILLQNQPELAGLFFDFGMPEKMELEAFMNRNFCFNVPVSRFAFLTGRSLSAFKRDFKATFNETPNRWLVRKRLQEGYFLIGRQAKKPSDIYLDLGFETLSHFSFAFKKQFGLTPTALAGRKDAIDN